MFKMLKKIYYILIMNVFLIANPIPPEGFEFNQSQRQAFYIFQWAVINADTLNSEGGHWIGAFNSHDETNGGLCENISEECPDINNDGLITENAEICVGSAQWNNSSYVSLPVMGANSLLVDGVELCEQTGTCYYLNTGEIPVFKIFDTSLDSALSAIPSSYEPFIDLEVYFIELLEHESYLDYNSIPLYEGNNLISFWALPFENSVEEIFGEMEHVLSVSSEGLISSYIDGEWLGNLENIGRNLGYWVTVSEDEVLNVFGIASELDLGYTLDNYKNLISFPSPAQVSIGDAIPDIVEASFLGIIGQGSASQRIDSNWEGTLDYFEGTNGYWALIDEPVDFNFIIDEARNVNIDIDNSLDEIPNQFQYNVSMNQAFYFIHNIYINNKPIESNQIILTYCNDNIVGSRVWNQRIVDQPAMGVDGTDNTMGYCQEGQKPSFKLYDQYTNDVIELNTSKSFEWKNNTIYNIDLFSNNINNPIGFSLDRVYPNPFNGNISINYTIQEPGNYSVEIIDLNGRSIEYIEKNTFHNVGNFNSNWESGINSSGTYFVKIIDESKNQNIIQKLMLIK